MKRNILTCAICVMLYVMQLPFLGMLIALIVDLGLPEAVVNAVIIFSFSVCVVAVVLSVLGLVAAVKGSMQSFSPLKATLGVKLALIPFFIINFIIWALFWLGTFNPFLIWAAPVVWVISLFTTYIFMLGGGVQNIVFLIRRFLAERRLKYALFAVLHFIYIADIVAAALAFYDAKREGNLRADVGSAATPGPI